MPRAILFWTLMLLWLIFGLIPWPAERQRPATIGSAILLFVLLALLGWSVYGAALQ